MTHACRALTYLMEAAPRVTPAVTDAVPLLLDKVSDFISKILELFNSIFLVAKSRMY